MGVFINFRNGDGGDFAEVLDTYAKIQFGEDEVFRSRRSIKPGVDYRPELADALRRSHVLLAVIGPDWLASCEGKRRIDEPDDWVRREIATAFEHDKRVIPVLIGPSPHRLSEADQLPADIAEIVHVQSIVINDRNWEPAIQELLAELIRLEPELADAVDDTVSDRFWARVPPWPMLGEPDWFITQLLNHERPWAAIGTMSWALQRDADDDPWKPSADQVLATLLLAMRPDMSDRPHSGLSGYEVGQLLDFLAGAEVDDLTLVRLELVFRRVLAPWRESVNLDRVLADNPQVYAEVVDLAHGEPHDQGLIWVQAQLALSDWRRLPGRTADGRVDSDRLHDWVRMARDLLAGFGRLAEHSEGIIGGMLTGSPAGEDGAWPAEPVRELLEQPGTERLAAGFVDGTMMNQGPGRQGRQLAEEYDGFAEIIAPEWPRTAGILRSCADQFRRLARLWDDEL